MKRGLCLARLGKISRRARAEDRGPDPRVERACVSPAGREHLLGLLRACETGKNRLRAGLPQGWIVGDKTGSGGHCSQRRRHRLAAGSRPLLVAAYMSDGKAGLPALCEAHADVGRLVAREL